jgi:hypothetical protein
MEMLLVAVALAALLLPMELLRVPPSWSRVVDGESGDDVATRAHDADRDFLELSLHGGLFTWQHIRSRLDALTEELAQLDRDPDVFAKAFHTYAARAAYQELLADASKLSAEPTAFVGAVATSLDLELAGPTIGPCEVLEL